MLNFNEDLGFRTRQFPRLSPNGLKRRNLAVDARIGIGPGSGRVSEAGWVRGVDPVIGPASESLRRRNPRESGDGLPVYGDLAGRRLCRGMILARSLRAESRLRLWIDRY